MGFFTGRPPNPTNIVEALKAKLQACKLQAKSCDLMTLTKEFLPAQRYAQALCLLSKDG